MERNELYGTLLVLLAAVIFSLLPILGKFAVGSVNPLFLSFAYIAIGAIVLIAILSLRGNLSYLFSRQYIPWFVAIGFFGSVWTSLFLFFGARLTSGINTALLLQIEPLYAILVGYVFLRERISRQQIAATAVILVGAALVLYNGALSLQIGDVLVLLAPLGWVAGNTLAKRIIDDVGYGAVTGGRLVFAAIILAFLSTLLGTNEWHVLLNETVLLAVLVLGVVVVGLGVFIWYAGLQRINMSKATTLLVPYPILGVVLAWPILGEMPTVYQLGGLALVVIGMVLLARVRSRQRE